MSNTSPAVAISIARFAIGIAQETLETNGDQLAHLRALFEIIDRMSDEVQFVSHLALIGKSYADHCAIDLVPPVEALDAAQAALREICEEKNHD